MPKGIYPRTVAHGVARERISEERIASALADVLDGMSWTKAAIRHGLNRENFMRRARRLDSSAPVGPRGWAQKGNLRLPTKTADIGYLAGLLDGEGNITIHRGRRTQIIVAIHNTDERLMGWLGTIGGRTYWRVRGRKRPCAAF